jgi:hypothetical protein
MNPPLSCWIADLHVVHLQDLVGGLVLEITRRARWRPLAEEGPNAESGGGGRKPAELGRSSSPPYWPGEPERQRGRALREGADNDDGEDDGENGSSSPPLWLEKTKRQRDLDLNEGAYDAALRDGDGSRGRRREEHDLISDGRDLNGED